LVSAPSQISTFDKFFLHSFFHTIERFYHMVSLNKGAALSLKKADGSALTKVILGAGWDTVKKGGFRGLMGGGGEIDLDASALLFAGSKLEDTVYFGRLNSRDGSVRHSGDNLTGAGDGDDEQIVVDLARVPANITSIVFTINSYSGQTFDKVENVFARVVDVSSGREVEVARYNLAESQNNTANVIAKLSRNAGGWEFTAIGEFTNGRTADSLAPTAVRFL
jgi:tellurium resistance protein TerZ